MDWLLFAVPIATVVALSSASASAAPRGGRRAVCGATPVFALALAMTAPRADGQVWSYDSPQIRGITAGLRSGSLVGRTELGGKPAPQFNAFLRHAIGHHLVGELTGGYGRITGDRLGQEYGTDMGLAEMRLLWKPYHHRYFDPYGYGGFGLVRYDLDLIAAARTAAVPGIGWGGTVPAGLGLYVPLFANVGIDLSAGYTHAFSDDLNSVQGGRGDDGFWNAGIGLVIGDLRLPRVQPPATLVPPLSVAPPEPADSDGDGLPDATEVSLFMTDPGIADSDGDGLPDGQEVRVHHTDPNLADTDGGSADDSTEVAREGNPLNAADDAEPVLAALPDPSRVFFGLNSDQLSAEARQELDEIALELGRSADMILEIQGFADPLGNWEHNLALSERRAKAVQDYLARVGIPAWRLRVSARGEEPDDTAAVEVQRRVELIFARL